MGEGRDFVKVGMVAFSLDFVLLIPIQISSFILIVPSGGFPLAFMESLLRIPKEKLLFF